MKVYRVYFEAHEEQFEFNFIVPEDMSEKEFSKLFTKVFKEVSLNAAQEEYKKRKEYRKNEFDKSFVENITTDQWFFESHGIIEKVAERLKRYSIKLIKPQFTLHGSAWGSINVKTKNYEPFDEPWEFEKNDIHYWWNKV